MSETYVKKERYGNLLISSLNARLPEDLRLNLSEKLKYNTWNLDKLLNFFLTDIKGKERLSTSYSEFHFESSKDKEKENHL